MAVRSIYLLYFFMLTLIPGFCRAQVVLEGVYQGKNVYVQNPLSGDHKRFCTDAVFVNGEMVLEQPATSAFEINLGYLESGEPVSIRIEHSLSCEPKIINPQVIRSPGNFSFSNVNAGRTIMSWQTSGERRAGKFFVEKWVNDEWTIKKIMDGKGSAELNMYSVEVEHFSGENRYRIKHLQNDGIIFYSEVVKVNSEAPPVTFYPQRVSEKIVLSRETDYKVTNSQGIALAKGHGKEIPLQHLKSGLYYLYIENRQEKFFKK